METNDNILNEYNLAVRVETTKGNNIQLLVSLTKQFKTSCPLKYSHFFFNLFILLGETIYIQTNFLKNPETLVSTGITKFGKNIIHPFNLIVFSFFLKISN